MNDENERSVASAGSLWISAMDRLPQHGQKVWYYGPHLGVWRGRYEYHAEAMASPHLFLCEESPGVCDRMDAPWWMPVTGERPVPPKVA